MVISASVRRIVGDEVYEYNFKHHLNDTYERSSSSSMWKENAVYFLPVVWIIMDLAHQAIPSEIA
jgi:hypothetical protein